MSRLTLIFSVFAILNLCTTAFANPTEFKFKDYNEAKSAKNFLRFDMSSTKLGLVTTSFTGFAKSFSVDGKVNGDKVENATVSFLAKDLDTDVDGRNEKMWTLCLDADNNPKILVKLTEPIAMGEKFGKYPGLLNVRGEDFPIELEVKISDKGETYEVEIKGQVSLKELKIPDPSIMIATVKDKIELSSSFTVSKVK